MLILLSALFIVRLFGWTCLSVLRNDTVDADHYNAFTLIDESWRWRVLNEETWHAYLLRHFMGLAIIPHSQAPTTMQYIAAHWPQVVVTGP